jgi:hypothetical protein
VHLTSGLLRTVPLVGSLAGREFTPLTALLVLSRVIGCIRGSPGARREGQRLVTRARTAVDAAAPNADAGHSSLADPRGLDEADVAPRVKQWKGNWAKLPSSRFLPAILRAMGAAYVAVLAIPSTREFLALDAPPWIVALAAVGAAALAVWSPRIVTVALPNLGHRLPELPVRRRDAVTLQELISQGEGKAITPLPIEEAVQYIGSRSLGQTTGHILEALVGRHR